MKLKLDNFRYLLISSSMIGFITGIWGPFYTLYVQDLGGSLENFGIAFGLLTISSAITSYIAGRHSDKIGRKPFLIASNLLGVLLLISYVFITSVLQLFLVQILVGVSDSIWLISETALLGDITKKKSRGRMLGEYRSIIGILQGVAMLFGGFLVGKMGFDAIFYLAAFVVGISTIPLLFIKER